MRKPRPRIFELEGKTGKEHHFFLYCVIEFHFLPEPSSERTVLRQRAVDSYAQGLKLPSNPRYRLEKADIRQCRVQALLQPEVAVGLIVLARRQLGINLNESVRDRWTFVTVLRPRKHEVFADEGTDQKRSLVQRQRFHPPRSCLQSRFSNFTGRQSDDCEKVDYGKTTSAAF